jgi:hypothetical protein
LPPNRGIPAGRASVENRLSAERRQTSWKILSTTTRQRAASSSSLYTPKGGFVFIIIGKAYLDGDNEGIDIHIMLRAPDDDTAVREALNALTEEGFSEADLDQIGTLMGAPDEEPHASAYQGALEGEVAIIRFG